MDSLGHNRATLLSNLEGCMDYAEKRRKEANQSQISLFGDEEFKYQYSESPEKEPDELLKYEKEALGFYLSRHPMDDIKPLLPSLGLEDWYLR